MDTDLDDVVSLELELLSEHCRGDRRRVSQLLHEDFLEHGASGRVWTRTATLDELEANPISSATATDVVAVRLGADVVLVTYRIGGTRASLRSSVWVREGNRWKMRFHQGTLTST